MKRCSFVVLGTVGLVVFPQQAWANAGTPLMWATASHLVIGNALIGVLEGLLMGWWFQAPRGRAIALMIAANYASAWVGGVLIRGAVVGSIPMDLNNGWKWFWIMAGVTYCLTLVLEWPFMTVALQRKPGWVKRIVGATFAVQSVSYILLFGWYWLGSRTSLYTKTQIVMPQDLSMPESVSVYYIAPSDGGVYRRALAGGEARKVFDLQSTNKNDRLFVRTSPANTNLWDLMALIEGPEIRAPRVLSVLTNLNVDGSPDWRGGSDDPHRVEGTWFNFGDVPALGSATNSSWKFRAGFWSAEGLRVSRRATDEWFRVAYETPFGAWAVRNAVHLPSDKVLFQLGDDQVCVFDPVERRVALLWRGKGLVAVIERLGIEEGVPRASLPNKVE